MATIDNTPNNGFPYPTGVDVGADFATGVGQLANAVDLMWQHGTFTNLPTASSVPPGAQYYATDTNVVLTAIGSGASASSWMQSQFSPGDYKTSAISSPPSGWLVPNGMSYDPVRYPFLYFAIGTQYGGTSSQPLLPNLLGRMPLTAGSGTGLTSRQLGQVGGEETHVLSVSETPPLTSTGQTNVLWLPNQNSNVIYNDTVTSTHSQPGYQASVAVSQFAANVSVTSNGGGQGHNTMPPWAAVSVFIKT